MRLRQVHNGMPDEYRLNGYLCKIIFVGLFNTQRRCTRSWWTPIALSDTFSSNSLKFKTLNESLELLNLCSASILGSQKGAAPKWIHSKMNPLSGRTVPAEPVSDWCPSQPKMRFTLFWQTLDELTNQIRRPKIWEQQSVSLFRGIIRKGSTRLVITLFVQIFLKAFCSHECLNWMLTSSETFKLKLQNTSSPAPKTVLLTSKIST